MKKIYTVLVVDDSRTIYKILAQKLSATGINLIDYAPDGESGIKIASVKNYDLITMDIDMPGMDGFEAAEEILKFKPNQKILFISSKYSPDHILKAKSMGIEHFLPKPFSIEKLILEMKLIQML